MMAPISCQFGDGCGNGEAEVVGPVAEPLLGEDEVALANVDDAKVIGAGGNVIIASCTSSETGDAAQKRERPEYVGRPESVKKKVAQ